MTARKLGIGTMIVIAAGIIGIAIAEKLEERRAIDRIFRRIEEERERWVY